MAEALRQIQDRMTKAMKSAGRQDRVCLIAVSKTKPIDAIAELYRAGQRDFGENYAQELVAKAQQAREIGLSEIRWHFIGHLQTNKVKMIIPHLYAIHSVDSLKLAQELAKRWGQAGREGKLPVFLEVNIDEESSKAGLPPETVRTLAQEISRIPELELQGLMCIPSAENSSRDGKSAFARLKELESGCHPFTRGGLSMGMSGDFEEAIREGSTQIRVGTALFGKR